MYHIVINPASRSGRGLKIWKEQVEPMLHRENISFRSYFSRTAGDVATIVSEICSNVHERPLSLIILGGDGTVNEAIQNNCDMIISHHPILLGGIKRIDFSTSDGRMLKNLIKNEIVVFSAHTNMDTAKNGINTVLADLFELTDAKILEENGEETGLGRYGNLQKSVSLDEFCETVKTKLNTPHIRVCGDLKAKIKTVAVASGSCSDIIPLAKEKGCDVIITADMKYHNAMDSIFSGISVIDAGHYPTEIIVMDIFEKLLKNTEIETVKSQNKDIFIYK